MTEDSDNTWQEQATAAAAKAKVEAVATAAAAAKASVESEHVAKRAATAAAIVQSSSAAAQDAVQTATTAHVAAIALAAEMAESSKLVKDIYRTKDAFIAKISHELRNPMNVVVGMIDLVLEADLPAAQRKNLEYAKAGAYRLQVRVAHFTSPPILSCRPNCRG